MGAEANVILQVLISTYGEEGIRRVAAASHPRAGGVEYIVSWQDSDGVEVPRSLVRDDFRIFRTVTKGLSKNRNNALSRVSAPLALISDDDVDFSVSGLTCVIRSFCENKDADIITFRYASESSAKRYPAASFSLSDPPKGYFVSSIEIAFRTDSVRGKLWFNENFGIGGTFAAGEEDIFIKDALDKGLKGIFIPEVIVRHDSPTTSEKSLRSASRPMAKGAVFLRLHPLTWPLRMLVHAKREFPRWLGGEVPSPVRYCAGWIKGAMMAGKLKVFPTPDYKDKYPADEFWE